MVPQIDELSLQTNQFLRLRVIIIPLLLSVLLDVILGTLTRIHKVIAEIWTIVLLLHIKTKINRIKKIKSKSKKMFLFLIV